MKKTIVYLISIIIVLSFSNCGGGSKSDSTEEKSTTHKILNYVLGGSQVIALCLDSNNDEECSLSEVLDKIKTAEITEEEEIVPILVQVKSYLYSDDVFTLIFNGFNHKDRKEISLMESMIDMNIITKEEANSFQTLDTRDAQIQFYYKQIQTFETTYHELKEQGISNKSAMNRTLKSIANTIKNNEETANQINECGEDERCAFISINTLYDEFVIVDDEETTETSTPSTEEVQRGTNVSPSKNNCEANGGKYRSDHNLCSSNWQDAQSICKAEGKELPSIDTLEQIIIDCGGDTDNLFDIDVYNESYQTCYQERGFAQTIYWSSTPNKIETFEGTALYMNFYEGLVLSTDITSENPYVSCL